MGKLSKDLKRKGLLLSALILLQTYAIIAFAPSGFYKLLHNESDVIIGKSMYLVTLEYILAAAFLMTTFFLLMGIILWSRKMAIFFLLFSFVVVLFEFLLHRESLGTAPTLLLPLLWLYAVKRKWSYFS